MTKHWMSQVRTIAGGVEAWSIDPTTYPETGELRPVREPDFIRCWPLNTFTGEPIVDSATPSRGDYDYLKTSESSYRLAIWNERGERAIEFDTGSFTDWEADEAPSVVSLDAAGNQRWRGFFGATTEDPMPVALTSTGAVLVGGTSGIVRALETSDGTLRWEAELGMPLLLPSVVFANGGSAWVGTSSRLTFIDAFGAVTETFWPGAEVVAAPSASADEVVYVADRAGTLHAVGRDGQESVAHGMKPMRDGHGLA